LLGRRSTPCLASVGFLAPPLGAVAFAQQNTSSVEDFHGLSEMSCHKPHARPNQSTTSSNPNFPCSIPTDHQPSTSLFPIEFRQMFTHLRSTRSFSSSPFAGGCRFRSDKGLKGQQGWGRGREGCDVDIDSVGRGLRSQLSCASLKSRSFYVRQHHCRIETIFHLARVELESTWGSQYTEQ